MSERSGNKSSMVPLILIAAVIGAGWFFFNRPAADKAMASVDDAIDLVVPDAPELHRRTSPIDEARQIADVINARNGRLSDSR